MKYCPLISFSKQYTNEVECMGLNCAFAHQDYGCLISQALATFVANNHRPANGYHYADDFDFLDECD